jgi:aerobic carbon-monoxide dehydrogenase medium subunit
MTARPNLPRFNYVRATDAGEVVTILKEYGPAARLLMGGTDLFSKMRDGAASPKLVVDVKHLPGMCDITMDEREGLTIGAGASMNQIASHLEVRAHYRLLAEAAASVASYQLRNRATIGGNLCNGSPCADITPATLVLNGRIVIYGENGFREISASEFHQGPGKTNLGAYDFLTAVTFPILPFGSVGRYYKLGRNKIGDISIVSIAVLGYPDNEKKSGFSFRIALGSVGPVVFRASRAEQFLEEHLPEDATFAKAAELARDASSPISDVRAGAEYRHEMVRSLTFQGLKEVFSELS